MDVLTGERMRKVDEATIERFCPGLELMERAGRSVADFIVAHYPSSHFKAAIFVGPGNNGGDALVVARKLTEEGRACSIHYLASPTKFTMDALKNHQRLQKLMDVRHLKEINATRPDWAKIIKKDLIDATVVIDGLFGTGLSRELDERARAIVDIINTRGLPVVSIDTPSGIDSDSGEILGAAVRATQTVTMGFPKLGMLFHPGKTRVGELHIADLDFPDEVLQVNSLGLYYLNHGEAAKRLPTRPPALHKYSAGTVLLIAGSRAYTGAALLAAEAALRSGCGIVYLAVPASIRPVVQTQFREAIVVPLAETSAGTIASGAADELAPYIEKADAIALGPGLGSHTETAAFVRELTPRLQKPLVIDADALGAFEEHPELLTTLKAPLVLTPHSGELKRLLKRDIPAEPLQRVEVTREAAKRFGATLVHKGGPTLVATSEGDVWVNSEGTSALATAGTGDVLTGLVVGFCAQGAGELDAAALACFLHGRSGSVAASIHSERGVVAGDVLNHLGTALLELERHDSNH